MKGREINQFYESKILSVVIIMKGNFCLVEKRRVGKLGFWLNEAIKQGLGISLLKTAGQFRPKRGHQISDPVVSVSFWSKPLSWTTCDALWPILAFYSHFVDIFGPRVGF